MSNMNNNESNGKSTTTINTIIEKTVDTTNELGITDKHPTQKKVKQVTNKLNLPLRKVAHASEYLVFALLIINALKQSNIKKTYIITIIICFLYACTDEYHQTFIDGRTGQFVDVLIDTSGSIIGCLLVILKNKIFKNVKQKK